MADALHLKDLLRRSQLPSDQPIVIRRKPWAVLLSIALLPFLAGLGGLALWLSAHSGISFPWFDRVLLVVLGLLILIGLRSGLDYVLGYELVIDNTGALLGGKLGKRHFLWSEINEFATWQNWAISATGARIPLGYQAVIQVDGSNNPPRLLRNLWLKGHFTAPFMELGGMDLVKLLNKAKHQFQGVS